MSGMKEVAALAGVSEATVSRVLNKSLRVSARTRERVSGAARELGYVRSFSASGLASGRNSNVGVLVPAVNRWYFSAVLEGITAALLEDGYDLTLYNSAGGLHHESLLNDFLLRQRIDAVIVLASKLSNDEIRRLMAVRKPVVVVGGELPGASALHVDDARISAQATNHLIGLGHEKIAHIGGLDQPGPSSKMSGLRAQGFRTAAEQAGLRLEPKWQSVSDFTVAGGYQAGVHLLGQVQERPTAIFAASDEMAIGAILAARDLGLAVPRDLSVIGIDGHELGPLFGLTTIDQFPEEQGRRAVKQLLEHIPRGVNGVLTNEIMQTELVIRSSTARLGSVGLSTQSNDVHSHSGRQYGTSHEDFDTHQGARSSVAVGGTPV